jgi:hypothetical protein
MGWVWVLNGLLLLGGPVFAEANPLDGRPPYGTDTTSPRPAAPSVSDSEAVVCDVSPTGSPPSRVLTLAEALDLALRQNGSLRVRQTEVEAARGAPGRCRPLRIPR